MKQVINMGMHELLQKDPEMWDLFCRKEEYHSSLRDKNNRFPYYASNYRHIFEPKASEYLMNNGYQVEYPEGKPFAVCLTHDIDGIYTSNASKRSDAIKKLIHGKFSESFQSIKHLRSKKIPLVNFEEIMNLEERYNAQSSFYFLALDKNDQDYRYSYDIKVLENEMCSIKDRGWEVGLHIGRRGSSDLNELKNEKKRLEKVMNNSITGCRNHYLNFVVPASWEMLHAAGLRYDCSFGYADCAGFRNGMCHPYRPVNLNTGKIIDIIEIPLVIMDASLFDTYMRLDSDRAWEITRGLIDAVAACHGVITLLWHNTSLIGEQTKFYEKILKYCAEKEAWMTSGEHISNWWKQNVEI
jgi:peptidoglycan/xylan/chitin deacetylase (PgdA/CDA1 family)